MRWHFHFLLALCGLVNATVGSAQDSKPENVVLSAKEAQRRAVQFFSEKVAVHGGYVYQVSEDLRYREGEGDAEKHAVWVQPPGTPAVGMAYVHAYERTKEEYLLSAARATAQCLVQGQLHSGGWQRSIEFEPERRRTQAYRVDGKPRPKAKNWSSFDDDQTQSVIRFLSKLDRALQFKDQEIHETNLRALDAVLANQFPNGAWAQGFETLGPEDRYPVKPGEFPQDWSRQQPKQDYWTFYTLNDNALVRIIDTLWLAHDIYGDDRYKRAALRGADFLVLAQMPDPQPAWAQQYDFEMHPTWARKFEPPSISGRESQDAVECLMMTYVRTGEDRYKPPIERALRYLSTCVTPGARSPASLN